jgi:quinol monooxygenase YgiN
VSHAVHRDVENPLRLFFYEQWADMDAVMAHFAVPESGGFVATAANLSAVPPTLQIFEATPVEARITEPES